MRIVCALLAITLATPALASASARTTPSELRRHEQTAAPVADP
jgi:hypothetical protein